MDAKKVREAIKYFKIMLLDMEGMGLKYIPKYYETAIEALEKQLQQKVEYEGGFSNNGFARYRMAKCPTRDRWYSNNDEVIYCHGCGQQLDWSE